MAASHVDAPWIDEEHPFGLRFELGGRKAIHGAPLSEAPIDTV